MVCLNALHLSSSILRGTPPSRNLLRLKVDLPGTCSHCLWMGAWVDNELTGLQTIGITNLKFEVWYGQGDVWGFIGAPASRHFPHHSEVSFEDGVVDWSIKPVKWKEISWKCLKPTCSAIVWSQLSSREWWRMGILFGMLNEKVSGELKCSGPGELLAENILHDGSQF